jgi:hypothetical protein
MFEIFSNPNPLYPLPPRKEGVGKESFINSES